MIYLDYSATTPVDQDILNSFVESSKYFGNPNSLHQLGTTAKKLIDESTKQISELLKIKPNEIIYTSGASEANNLALKGIVSYNRGKKIITTNFEHSSIYAPLHYLSKLGYEIIIIGEDSNGKIDLKELKENLDDEVVLVTITAVSSETGVIEPIDEIKKLVKKYPRCLLHVDLTQALGKIPIDLTDIDMASMSAHKLFGIKGIGMLYKNEKVVLEPLISGGKSTTIFRSGTPATSLIVSLSKTIRKALENLNQKYQMVLEINNYLRKELENIPNIIINSPKDASPYILNISVLNIKPETLLHTLELKEIYISTQTACSSKKSYSEAVYKLTRNIDQATHSVRISLSYKTTKEEIDTLIRELKEICK